MAFNWFGLRKSNSREVSTPRAGFSYNNGNSISEDSAMKISAYYRGVIYISSQVAKLPWNVKNNNNEIIEDRINYLLNVAPNSEMDAMDFRLFMIQSAINLGNGYAEIERDAIGRAVALWPLNSSDVQVWRTPEKSLVYKVQSNGGPEVWFDPKDIFHLKNLHSRDGLIGEPTIAFAQRALSIAQGSNTFAEGLFNNSGMPSGTLTIEGTLGDEAYERIKSDWKDKFGGRKSGGIAILESGLKFAPISMSPDILQFLESRKFSVLEIARFLGLPPTKLFDIDANSYNTQEQSNLEVATDTLSTWCRRLELQADVKLLSGQFAGRKSRIDLYDLFRGDMTTRSNYFSKMMQSGAITPNQIRKKEGESPYVGGDRYYIAVNNFTPADRLDEVIDAQIAPKTAPPAPQEKPTRNPSNEITELEKVVIEYLKKD